MSEEENKGSQENKGSEEAPDYKAMFEASQATVTDITGKLDVVTKESGKRGLDLMNLKKQVEDNTKKKAAGSTDVDEIRKDLTGIIDGKNTEITQLKTQARNRNLGDSIRAAAKDAVNADQVTRLLIGDIDINDNDVPIIKDKNGKELSAKSGQLLTIQEYVGQFLKDNPHMVKASGNSGAGSNGSTGNTGGNGANSEGVAGFKDMADLAKNGTPEQWAEHRRHFIKHG